MPKSKSETDNPQGVNINTDSIIAYRLSDKAFIDKGWTMLPVEKIVNVYRMRPADPEFDWFKLNKHKGQLTYDTGEKLAEFDENGLGRWYYRNGRLALNYYDAEELNAQQRYVIFSNGEPDDNGRSRPVTVLGMFDYLGNGVVFDHSGKIRLKYNQMEGVILDKKIGPVSHWKWHTLNDPPVLQRVMIDTQLEHKDPRIMKFGTDKVVTKPYNEDMVAIEFENFIKEQNKRTTNQKFSSFQIKMKALKINECFSLRILDQKTIILLFQVGTATLKLNIGMILEPNEIVDTDSTEVGEVITPVDRFPARTDSIAVLQKTVVSARQVERERSERARRLRPTAEPCANVDQLTAALSKPLRPTIQAVPSGSTTTASPSGQRCRCNRRKPSQNLYYDTRLV